MPVYEFQAKNLQGKIVRGEVNAIDEGQAKEKIRARQLIPSRLRLKSGSNFLNSKKDIEASEASKANGSGVAGGIKSKELQIFTRQFAVLISSGVPIVQSLEAMAQGAKSPTLIKVLNNIVADLQAGKRLAEAMSVYPQIYDRMYVNLVKAGEEGGVLDEILNRLADYIEKSGKIKGKIKGALVYPIAIIIVAIIVISCILVFVIPKFVEMFQSNNKQLPWLTLQVIAASDFLKQYWWILLLSVVGGIAFIRQYYRTDDGRKKIDTILIEVPVFGVLIQKGAIARFSRTLATLIAAGVRIVDCLEIASATTGNYVIERSLLDAKESINKGRTIAEPLKKQKHIPTMVSQMIGIGEQTGNMDVMLGKIADFFEDEVETAAEALTSLLEPILMVVLGGIVAVLVSAMYLPIFDLAGAVGG